VIYWAPFIPADAKPWWLMGIAILRTVLDYALAWNFHFPAEEEGEKG
jgi:hypothetical protein